MRPERVFLTLLMNKKTYDIPRLSLWTAAEWTGGAWRFDPSGAVRTVSPCTRRTLVLDAGGETYSAAGVREKRYVYEYVYECAGKCVAPRYIRIPLPRSSASGLPNTRNGCVLMSLSATFRAPTQTARLGQST